LYGTLAHVLQYLASWHVFMEVSPDVYANNHISLVLTKTKPLKELKKEYVLPMHVAALKCFNCVSDVMSCSKLTKYEDAPTAAFTGHIYVLP